jgi:hypothetical protein
MLSSLQQAVSVPAAARQIANLPAKEGFGDKIIDQFRKIVKAGGPASLGSTV